MKNLKRIFVLVLTLAMMLSCIPVYAAPGGDGSFGIRVTDNEGNPIPGAVVKFEDITAGVATAVLLGSKTSAADGIA